MNKPNWSIALKMIRSDIFTANGQHQNQTLKRLKERRQTTAKEKGIDKCKCLRSFVFNIYDVRIKYGKHMEN